MRLIPLSFLFLTLICIVLPISTTAKIQEVSLTKETTGLIIVYPKTINIQKQTQINLSFDVLDSNQSRLDSTQTDCFFYMVNNFGSSIVNNDLFYSTTNKYWFYNLTVADTSNIGLYSIYVYCNNSLIGENGFISTDFEITNSGQPNNESMLPMVVVVLSVLFLSLIFLIGAATMGDEHNVLKITLFLMSMIPTFISWHISILTINRFYNFPQLENVIGDTTYWFVLIFIVFLSYFVIYFIWKAFNLAAQKKDVKLNY